MKHLKISTAVLSLVLIISCGKDDDPTPEELIDPSDANSLSSVIIMPEGTQSSNGNPPSPSNGTEAPSVSNNQSSLTSSNGSSAPLSFSYSNAAGDLAGCYVQIGGAGNYFNVPYNTSSGNTGDLLLPIGIPTNILGGEFLVNFCVYTSNGEVSNIVTTSVDVLRLGTGSTQISLSWNNETDQDLYVTEPSGETISYIYSSSVSGGELDRDDVDGFGPENIFWNEDAPDGTYSVSVNDYTGGSTETTYYITVSGSDQTEKFSGKISFGNTVEVVTFTKNGSRLEF